MIIKFAKDAREGACDYLENGTDGDRDEKDVRIQLSDLSCEETIGAVNELLKKQGKWDNYKDNYKHIILSLNDDDLTYEQMQELVKNFLALYMHAYDEDEYIWYAEAHKPKKEYNENGEKRHLHFHIFISKYSPILNRRLKFDSHPRRRQELNLIKNYLVKKYNLNYTFTNKIISKSKIDIYSESFKSKKELKNAVEEYILSNLHNYDSFEKMIKDLKKTFNVENIKFSKNAKTPYISIKFKEFQNNIRFKGLLFNKESFLEAREAYLSKESLNKYDPVYKLSLEEMLKEMRKRQEYFKEDIDRRFVYARKRKENLMQNREYLLFKEIQKFIKEGKEITNVDIKQVNRVLFKLKLLNTYLNLNLAFLQNIENLGIFQTKEGVRLVRRGRNINTEVKVDGDSFMITSRGKDEAEEAKIAAQIVAEKIRAGEIKKEDLVLDSSREYRKAFEEELDKLLKGKEVQVSEVNVKTNRFSDSTISF